MPEAVQTILSVLNLLAGDLSFTHPDCLGMQSFSAVFGLNIAALVASLLLFVVVVQIRFSIKEWQSTREVVAKYSKDFRVLHHQWKKRQLACGAIALFMFAYELLEVNAWGTLYCQRVGSNLLLVEDPNEACLLCPHSVLIGFRYASLVVTLHCRPLLCC